MVRTSTLDRLNRLEILTARLKSGETLTGRGLSQELGISIRTLSRDIELLRDQGLPIEADRGRGGGLRLTQRWGVGRLALNYGEAVDLLVSLAAAEQMQSPLLMANLGSVRSKLMASFSPAMSAKISGLKARILVGKPVGANLLVGASTPKAQAVAALHQAFLNCHGLTISYRAVDGRRTRRIIQPHYLLLCAPLWYVMAFDELRGDVRSFRCDRIVRATAEENRVFRLLPFERFSAALEGVATL
jgi:predicted DNA-binding transcriptional regulator YafY